MNNIKTIIQIHSRKYLKAEKIAIAKADRKINLNKRSELFYSCPPFKKLILNINLSHIVRACFVRLNINTVL